MLIQEEHLSVSDEKKCTLKCVLVTCLREGCLGTMWQDGSDVTLAIDHRCKTTSGNYINENIHPLILKTGVHFSQNIHCGYTLEPPRRGGSNEYPQCMFWIKNKKNSYTPANPSFSIEKWGIRGYIFHGDVFLMCHIL